MSDRLNEITFKVRVDENQIPEMIEWNEKASGEKAACDAAFLTVWDKKEKNTLRIDLWTKDMMVDDMRIFFHQMMLSMSDTYARATGEKERAEEIKQFAMEMGEKMGIIKRND